MTHRQDEVVMVLSKCAWYYSNKHILCQVSSHAKFQVNQTGDDKFMLRTKNYSKELSNSRGK